MASIVRCRAEEAITLVEQAAAAHGIQKGELTLGSDNGSAFTARRFKARLAEQGIRHRRGGYRDPESQGLHRKLARETERSEVWLNEYETRDQAAVVSQATSRATTTAPTRARLPDAHEVRRAWEDQRQLQKQAA